MKLRLLVVLSLSLPATAQHICLAEGTASSLRIATVPESNPNAPDTLVVQNVELLPIEITGRTVAREFDASRSRRVEHNGVLRVELPDGGRVFRYRRNGGQHWGFLHVAAGGAARVVIEHPGVAGALDPFEDRIAVSDDGLHGAVALQAGGLAVFKLDGGVYASTGRPDRLAAPASHSVEPASPMVGPTHVFYVTDNDRIYRCSLADNATPVDLTPPPVPNTRLKDELAMSGDGMHVVFLYGPQNLQWLYHVTTAGGSTQLPPPAEKYEEPNYLPEGAGDPDMLLNEDGSRLFFVESQHDELFLLDMQGALPILHITDDLIFQPYIGVHILPKFTASELIVAVGHPARHDWYRAVMTASGGTVTNLTGTGSTLQPYPEGTLDPRSQADAGASMLVVEQTATGADLRRLHYATGASAIVQQDGALEIASGLSLSGTSDLVAKGAGGDRLYRGPSSALFAATPAGVSMTRPVHGVVSATRLELLIPWGVPIFYLPDGSLLPGQIEFGAQQIVMTKGDGIVLNGPSTLRYIALGVDVVVQRPPAAVRMVLSGAGG